MRCRPTSWRRGSRISCGAACLTRRCLRTQRQRGFGDFYGFMAGWTYWMSNLPYFPAILYFGAGSFLFAAGDRGKVLANESGYFISFALIALGLITLLNMTIADKDGVIYAFGSAFSDAGKVDGIHDIHMNQGNPMNNHGGDNGIWQDGALFISLPSKAIWTAVFIAFQTESWNTDSKGNPN